MADLKPGDLVRLGGRGPLLAVESLTSDSGVVLVGVVWLDADDRLQRALVRRECLTDQGGSTCAPA